MNFLYGILAAGRGFATGAMSLCRDFFARGLGKFLFAE
jgi:hypothetical protein